MLHNQSPLFYPTESNAVQDIKLDRHITSENELNDKKRQLQLKELQLIHHLQQDQVFFQTNDSLTDRDLQQGEQKLISAKKQLDQKHQVEFTQYTRQWDYKVLQEKIDFEKIILKERQRLEWELQQDRHAFQMQYYLLQMKMTQQTEEYRRILDHYPWRLMPSVILKAHGDYQQRGIRPPLQIVLSPPEIDFEKFPIPASGLPKMEKALAEELRRFVGQHYPRNDALRPIEFIGGVWDTNRLNSETAVKLLHYLLEPVPTLILSSEIDGDLMNFHIGAWDLGRNYDYSSVMSGFYYSEFIYESAKQHALQWKKQKEVLLSKGLLDENIKLLGGDDEFNLVNLELENTLKESGIDRPQNYRPTQQGFKDLLVYLRALHCIVVGIAADQYFFSHYYVAPKLPAQLADLINNIPENRAIELINLALKQYQYFCEKLINIKSSYSIDYALELALEFSCLPDYEWGKQQLLFSLKLWLKQRCIYIENPSEYNQQQLLRQVCSVLDISDRNRIRKIKKCLEKIDDHSSLSLVDELTNEVFEQMIKARQLALTEETERQRRAEEEKRQYQVEIAERQRQMEEAECQRQTKIAERKRQAEEAKRRIAEALHRRELEAERQRQTEEIERQRQKEIAERKHQIEEAERQRLAREIEQKRQIGEAQRQHLAREAEKKHRLKEAQLEIEKRKHQLEETERKNQAELAERKRQTAEAERQFEAAIAERKRQFEEAEKKRLAEAAEFQRQLEEAEKKRQAEEAERQRQVEEAERQHHAKELERKQEIELTESQSPGRVFQHALKFNGHGPEMIVIAPGKFRMGDLTGRGTSCEKPIRYVKINYTFAIGKYPVTFAEYDKFCEMTGRTKVSDRNWGRDKRPVINITWNHAVEYCKWLSQQTGHLYRLPSEAEWEYAARAGRETDYWYGDVGGGLLLRYAWYQQNSSRKTHPVNEKLANHWGLHDLLGNTWEWCADIWHDDYTNAPMDGSAWKGDGHSHVLRGGSWNADGLHCRCSTRVNYYGYPPYNGFRVVCIDSLWK